jgi:hypothetical protein
MVDDQCLASVHPNPLDHPRRDEIGTERLERLDLFDRQAERLNRDRGRDPPEAGCAESRPAASGIVACPERCYDAKHGERRGASRRGEDEPPREPCARRDRAPHRPLARGANRVKFFLLSPICDGLYRVVPIDPHHEIERRLPPGTRRVLDLCTGTALRTACHRHPLGSPAPRGSQSH